MLWGHAVFRLFLFVFLLGTLNANADGFGFMTPSGNIYCNGYISGGGGLSCTIVSRSGPPAMPKPGACTGVWGHNFELEGSGPAEMSCNTWPGGPQKVDYSDIAQYGVSADFGDISCTSEKTGFTCRNKTGHGFFLSRRKQVILAGNDAAVLPQQTSPQPRYSRDQIRDFQSRLNTLGYNAGRPDGAAGRRTRAAIRAFQAARQAPQTGILSEADVNALMIATSPQPVTSKAIGYEETSRRQRQETAASGSANAQRTVSIADVQKRLDQLGYDVGQIDGVLSQKMRDATAAFQRDNNRNATGVLDQGGIDLLFQLTDAGDAKAGLSGTEETQVQEVTSTDIQRQQPNSTVADASGRVTYPVPGDPLIDFRIDQCEATRGFGSVWYFSDKGPVFALSDLCIDEKNGKITSIETREGFTLVEKSKNGKQLEIIGSAEKQAGRTKARFVRLGCVENDPDDVFFIYYYFLNENEFRFFDTSMATMLAHTVPPLSNKPKKSDGESMPMSLILFSQAELPEQTTQVFPDVQNFRGNLSVTGNTGVFSIVEGGGVSVGEASGTIELQFNEDGEVFMSGNLTAKNQRLAGHEPGEWISMTAEIPHVRGQLLGTDGDQIWAYGIAKGSFIDTDGQTHQFRAQVRWQSCLY